MELTRWMGKDMMEREHWRVHLIKWFKEMLGPIDSRVYYAHDNIFRYSFYFFLVVVDKYNFSTKLSTTNMERIE
jgi:hypothetical protein